MMIMMIVVTIIVMVLFKNDDDDDDDDDDDCCCYYYYNFSNLSGYSRELIKAFPTSVQILNLVFSSECCINEVLKPLCN